MAETLELTVGDRTVRVSHPDKVYFPQRGLTKADLVRYYLSVGDGVLRALRDRPTTLERYISGVEGESFFQKRAPKNLPGWIPTGRISFPSGRYADEICPTEVAAVLWAANLGTFTFTPGRSAAATPSTRTSCGSTSTRSPGRTSPTRSAPRRSCGRSSTAWA